MVRRAGFSPGVAGISAVAVAGMVQLSGTGQPVTAQPHDSWQSIAAPPLSARTDALGVRVGHRVLVLGGRGPAGTALRDGASYDVETGRWRRLPTPLGLTSSDRAVAAAGVALVRHTGATGVTWWAFDPTPGTWARLRGVPRGAGAPFALGSEVYAIAGRRVVVFSVALDRWTPLPPDLLRPALRGRRVSVSRAGTVVSGHAGCCGLVADRFSGTRWERAQASPGGHPVGPRLPVGVARRGATVVPLAGRLLVVSRGQAWIHTT